MAGTYGSLFRQAVPRRAGGHGCPSHPLKVWLQTDSMHDFYVGMPGISFLDCARLCGLQKCFPHFVSLQTLPRVPKLYTPSVACPVCSYPNDEHFKFCQQCGYVRRFVRDHTQSPVKKCEIDEGYIAERLQQLSQQRSSSCCAKQKSALELELGQFLASLTTPNSLSSALPADIKAFLVWKDRGGKTKVHQSACPAVSQTGMSCACPKRLAFGTVDSLIGKLRAIFVEHGRGSEWQCGGPSGLSFSKNLPCRCSSGTT